MYPQAELTRLAAHKAALRRGIALRRAACTSAAARLAEPIAWLDRMLATWRRLAPLAQLAAVPLAALATRTLFPRLKFLAPLLRWAPLVVSVASGIGSIFKARR
jgi:hypothetical protein